MTEREYHLDALDDVESVPNTNDDLPVPAWPVPAPDRWFVTDGYGRSVSMYRLGGDVFPMVTVKTCHTCTSQFRVQLETLILRGYSYKMISDNLPEEFPVSADSLRNHKDKGHMPVEKAVIRQIAEERAKELGLDIENAAKTLIDYITLARTVIVEVYEKLADGKIEPTLRDALAFARLLHDAQVVAGDDLDQEIVYRMFVEYQITVRQHTSPEQFQSIADSIANSPVVRGLLAKAERHGDMNEPVLDVEEPLALSNPTGTV